LRYACGESSLRVAAEPRPTAPPPLSVLARAARRILRAIRRTSRAGICVNLPDNRTGCLCRSTTLFSRPRRARPIAAAWRVAAATADGHPHAERSSMVSA
jgi:hypothetical protein